MTGLLVAVLLAALAYIILAALTGSGALALVGGIIVLLASGGYVGRSGSP